MGLLSRLFVKKSPEPIKEPAPKPKQSSTKAEKKYGYYTDRAKNDSAWKRLSNDFEKHIVAGNIGLAGLDRYEMGKIREAEGDFVPAVHIYLQAFYYDATGVSTLQDLYYGNKPSVVIPPALLKRLKACLKKTDLSEADIKKLYLDVPTNSQVPGAVFSLKESYDLLHMYLTDDFTAADKLIGQAEKRYKPKAR